MKCFLSSTYIDLVTHRQAAVEVLERLGYQVGRMEVFGARPEEPMAACLSEVEECEIFIGIYAHRYGFISPGSDISVTHSEFLHAQRTNKKIFCFLVAKDYPWNPEMIEDGLSRAKLLEFKRTIEAGFVRETFTTPEDLAYKIATSISRYVPVPQVRETPNPYIERLRSCGDLVELLESTLRAIEQVTQTDYNQLFLTITIEHQIQLVCVADAIPPYKLRYHHAALDGIIGETYLNGRMINASNVRERPMYIQAVLETKSELSVPISNGYVVLGVINSESEETEHYDQAICTSVEMIAAALGNLLPLFGWSPSLQRVPRIEREPLMQGLHDSAPAPPSLPRSAGSGLIPP